MIINSDINVLGSIKDYGIVSLLLNKNGHKVNYSESADHNFKTSKSFNRMRDALQSTVVKFDYPDYELLSKLVLDREGVSENLMMLLFWNSSKNNDLFNYLNLNVFYSAYYSGRVILRKDDVVACLNELKYSEEILSKWSKSTIETTATKYLSLLKKFNLLDGRISKKIKHIFLSDKIFLFFLHWITNMEENSNVLASKWLPYSFMEKEIFIERALKKKYRDFIDIQYTGDKLTIKLLSKLKDIYDAKFQS